MTTRMLETVTVASGVRNSLLISYLILFKLRRLVNRHIIGYRGSFSEYLAHICKIPKGLAP